VSAENEIIHSLSTSYDMILSVISVFVSSVTNIGHIRPISMRYTFGLSKYNRTFGLSSSQPTTEEMAYYVGTQRPTSVAGVALL